MSMDYECSVTGDYAITALAMNFIVTNNNQIELTFVSFCDDKINIQYIFVDEDIEKEECEHVYGKWTIDTEATCVTNGTKHKTCVKCGDVVEDVITATGIHDYNAITGKCLHCESDLGRTITWEDQILGGGYINFAPVGNKLYLNFTTIEESSFYFDLEAQQYFEDGITEDDFDKNLVKEVKLYKDGDFDNEIELDDNDCIGSSYFWWESVADLEANTKYYLVLTLDQEYEEFMLYFWSIEKKYDGPFFNLEVTTTDDNKFYDGEPFVVEATADEGEVSVIYFDMAVDYGTGTLTPPTEPGNYYVKIYAETETKFDDDFYYIAIIENPKTISVGENYGLYYDILVGTEFQTKVEVEGGKEYVLYVGELDWEYEVSDDTSTYEFEFDGNQYYCFTAKKDGFITITGTKFKDDYNNPYYVGVFDIIEIEDVSVDHIVTLAPYGRQIFKVSTENAPYLNFNFYDVFDEELDNKFYISCFDPYMGIVDDWNKFNENFVIFYDVEYYDYYYFEVYNCNEEETQQFNFKSLPIVADELTIGTPYTDDTNDDAVYGTLFITKVYLEKDKTYIINTFSFYTEIFAENLQYIKNFEDITEYTPEKDGWIYLFSYKQDDDSYSFIAGIGEPVVMTNPYDSDNANNKVTLAPYGEVYFKFTLTEPAPVRLNASFSDMTDIDAFLYSEDFETPCGLKMIDYLYTTYDYAKGEIKVLPAGNYYFNVYNMSDTEIDVNAYFVCMHDCLTDYGVCLNCGAFVGHKLLVDSSIYPTIGAVGDKEYYFIENMVVGNYHIDEDSDGHESVEYSVYDEEGNAVAEGLKAGGNFGVTVAGKYYVVVERVNDEDDSIGFEIQFQE